jgi:hypothetical protein
MKKGYIYYLHTEIKSNDSNEWQNRSRNDFPLSIPAGKCMKITLKKVGAVSSPLLCRPIHLSIPCYKNSEADTALLNNLGTNDVLCGFVVWKIHLDTLKFVTGHRTDKSW